MRKTARYILVSLKAVSLFLIGSIIGLMAPGFLLYATLAFRTPSVSLVRPTGSARVTFLTPPSYLLVNRGNGKFILRLGDSQIMVTWRPGMVDAAMSKAMNESAVQARKKGYIAGSATLGKFAGPIYNVPVPAEGGKKGVDLHVPLVYRQDLISVSYYDPHGETIPPATALAMIRRFIASGKVFGLH